MRAIQSIYNNCLVSIYQASEKYEFFRWAGIGVIIALVVWFPFILLHH